MKSHFLSFLKAVLAGFADYMLHTSLTKEEIGFLLILLTDGTQQISVWS